MFAPLFPSKNFRIRPVGPKYIVIHHTETKSPQRTFTILSSKGLSTHFEVDREGKVHQYLDPGVHWAMHAGWMNRFSIGIDVTHYGNEQFTPEQVQATVDLVTQLCKDWNIPQVVAPDRQLYAGLVDLPKGCGIFRHRNVAKTLCPANFPMEKLNA